MSVPKTKEEAVDILLAEMDDNGKRILRDMGRQSLVMLHNGFGRYVRNKFRMFGDNACTELKASMNEKNPDNISMQIIYALWERLQKK